MIPLTIRADLAAGFAHAPPWGVSLDGLLASQLWARTKAADAPSALAHDNPPDLELPLARCHLDPSTWHWAATCAWPLHHSPDPEVHYWTARTDTRALAQLSRSQPKVVSERQGPFRAHRMPLLVSRCTAVQWTCVGDAEAIAELLHAVVSIGKKRTNGEGEVLAWHIDETPDLHPFAASHLTPTGALARPVPPRCLIDHPEVTHGGLGRAGLRPPVMHPSRQLTALLPAPWNE